MSRWFTLQSWFRRNSIAIALTITVFANLGILMLLAQATSQIRSNQQNSVALLKNVAAVTDQIKGASQQRTRQIDQLNRHLDCIVLFFSQPDRNQKSISDIDTCTVQTTDSGSSVLTQSPYLGGPTQSTPVIPQSTPTNSTPESDRDTDVSNTVSGDSTNPGFFTQLLSPVRGLLHAL